MSQRPTIVCVDDEPIVLVSLREQLERELEGVEVETAEDTDEALELLEELRQEGTPVPVVISDQIMPGMKGDALLALVRERSPKTRTVMLTGQADAEAVGRAVNSAGLYRYLSKPWQQSDLVLTVRGAVDAWHADREEARLRLALEEEVRHRKRVSDELLRYAHAKSAGPLLGESAAIQELRARVAERARDDAPVLVRGAPGTGLEATARAIHAESARAQQAFIVVPCALVAHPDELCGTTGDDRTCHVDVARGGTLYLHGVDHLRADAQRRIVEVMAAQQAGSDERDVRVIAGAFGAAGIVPELGARLGAPVAVPPLRERVDDIGALSTFFLADAAQRTGRPAARLSESSLSQLKAYPWPGNVAELRQVIERAVFRATTAEVDVTVALGESSSALGNFRLTERLGEGGMGEVWRAEHRHLARPAAVKLVRRDTLSPEATERFRREARAIALLRSPHTIELYDYGVSDDGQLFYAMELIEGLDLRSLVEQHGPMPEARAIYLLRQACRSLAEAHAGGLAHRDVKPANLFVGHMGFDADFLKVLDFGMVTAGVDDGHLTGEVASLGTAAFLSPEAAHGEKVEAPADLYGLGCVAFWMVTGQLVFPAKTPIAMAMGHASKPPPSFASVGVHDVSEGFEAVVRLCLEKDPKARPSSPLKLERRLGALEAANGWTVDDALAWWDARH